VRDHGAAVSLRHGASGPVVALMGEVDLANVAEIGEVLRRSVPATGEQDVVLLDLAGVTFMDMAGSESVASLCTYLRERGTALVIRDARPMIRQILYLRGLNRDATLIATD
jgi:anti-anti-sigma factor